MAGRNLQEIAAGVQRRTSGLVPMGEILESIGIANKKIHTEYEWPWTFGETNLQIQPTYSTGTLSITDQTATFTGTGTTWVTSWVYKRLILGTNDHLISSFGSATTGTLAQTVNLGSNQTNVGYTIYQDLYALPDDCEFGNILIVMNPTYRYRLRYLPRYTLEWQAVWPRIFNNIQTGFADGGYDVATGKSLIRMAPPPAAVAEYKMIYRRRPPDLTTLTQTTWLPESFDDVMESMSSYLAKTARAKPIAGWMEDKQEAYQRLKAMRRRMVAAAGYDAYATYVAWPYYEGASNEAGGLSIGPTTGSYP
jgi:hypothetical protein